MDRLYSSAILLAALGSGVLGGFFFSFSNTIMGGLGRIPAPAGIAAMQSINVVVQNPLFFLFFMGTPLLCAILAILALLNLGQGGALAILAGSLLVILGMFAVTIVLNVPMNNALAAVDSASAAGADYWRVYLDRWTMWNHVRTVACLGAGVAFILALMAR